MANSRCEKKLREFFLLMAYFRSKYKEGNEREEALKKPTELATVIATYDK